MNTRKMVIMVMAWIGLSMQGSGLMAGTYIYHDANGKEVRELPRPERTRSEAGGRAAGSGPRNSAERRADVVIEVDRGTPSGVQR